MEPSPAPACSPSHWSSTNISNLSPSHGLQFTNGFYGVQSSMDRLLQHGFPMESQVLLANLLHRWMDGLLSPQATGPVRSLLQQGFPMESQLLQAHPPALVWGSPGAAGVYLCITMSFHGLQENLNSSTWSTSSSPFTTELSVCRVVPLTTSHSSLLWHLHKKVFFLLKYVITEVSLQSLVGSAWTSNGSTLESALVIDSVRHGGILQKILREATPAAPCYQNFAVQI